MGHNGRVVTCFTSYAPGGFKSCHGDIYVVLQFTRSLVIALLIHLATR